MPRDAETSDSQEDKLATLLMLVPILANWCGSRCSKICTAISHRSDGLEEVVGADFTPEWQALSTHHLGHGIAYLQGMKCKLGL